MDATLNFIDYSTAAVLYSKPQSRSVVVKACPDERATMRDTTNRGKSSSFFTDYTAVQEKKPESAAHLMDSSDPYIYMANDILVEIAKDFGEYEITSTIEVSDDTEGLASSRDEDIFEAAVANAEGGNLTKACEQWASLEIRNPEAVFLKYNLGVCKEAVADYEGALDYYMAADSMLLVSDEKVTDAMKRLDTKKRSSGNGAK
jgi:hypothetical protein